MYTVINESNIVLNETKDIEKYLKYLIGKLELDNSVFNIIFVTNGYIKKINREYRNIDKDTDVISFALEDDKNIEYDGFRLLGDIYISVEKAIEQASDYNHSILRELSFLVTHGILHLLGYDHMNELEESIMFTLQKELLDNYGIKR